MRRSSIALQSSGSGCSNIYNHFGARTQITWGLSKMRSQERSCQNPANGGATDLQTAGDLGLADASTMQLSHLVRLESRCHRPTQTRAVPSGIGQAGAHAFPQNLSFELGKDGQ